MGALVVYFILLLLLIGGGDCKNAVIVGVGVGGLVCRVRVVGDGGGITSCGATAVITAAGVGGVANGNCCWAGCCCDSDSDSGSFGVVSHALGAVVVVVAVAAVAVEVNGKGFDTPKSYGT